ncbi:MAG: HAD family hydrolase [Spirochaetes bacterium]|nr:HAD family hydrolase [Spirochaetota bacterium]
MKFNAVIFDLDGTLLDTIGDIAGAANAVLESMGFQAHPVESYRRFLGDGIEVLARRALPESMDDPADVSRIASMIREEYGRRWSASTDHYPGIRSLIEELRGAGIRIAVLSNKPHDFTVLMVRHYFRDEPFNPVMGLRPGVPRKPDPAAALEIAGILGIEPTRCVFLGDSDNDMLTAVSAGMYAVGAGWGYRGERELLENGARTVLQSPGELMELMGLR